MDLCQESDVKAVYYHPAYLTYMQSTSYEMQAWMTPIIPLVPTYLALQNNLHCWNRTESL